MDIENELPDSISVPICYGTISFWLGIIFKYSFIKLNIKLRYIIYIYVFKFKQEKNKSNKMILHINGWPL